jgi:hypothetical protein
LENQTGEDGFRARRLPAGHGTTEILFALNLIIWKIHGEGSASAVASFELGKGCGIAATLKQNAWRSDYYHLH